MHTVIVGGGFGGVKAALEISKRQIGRVTLISNQSYFIHHATLYATATGKSTEESVIPLSTIFANHKSVDIVEDTIVAIDPHRHLIRSEKHDYHYDKLILALGSVTSFYAIPGLEKHSYNINTIQEVRQLQDHIYDEVVTNKLDKEYFVIGAGPTGVEFASALQEYLTSLKQLYRLKNTGSKVTLVEKESRILSNLSTTASYKIVRQLKKRGVQVLTNRTVTALTSQSIQIGDKVYATSTAIWTSGLTNNPFYKTNREFFDLTKNGYVSVNPYLEAFDNVYVIGDNNSVTHSGSAWSAYKQATHVAKNITRIASGRPQKAFRPSSAPVGIPVGERWGYVEWLGLYVAGQSGAVVRRWMELYGYCKIVPYRTALPIWQSHKLSDVDDRF